MNLDRGGVFLDIGLEMDDDVISRDENTAGVLQWLNNLNLKQATIF